MNQYRFADSLLVAGTGGESGRQKLRATVVVYFAAGTRVKILLDES